MEHNPADAVPGDDRGGDRADQLIVVPDDARELDRDVEAWHREQRWARRRRFFERLMPRSRRTGRPLVPIPLITLGLICIGLVGATITMLTTRGPAPAPPPLALELASPSIVAGSPGGLLPADTLSVADGKTSSRDLRPGIVAVVGPSCGCADAISTLGRQAATNALPVYLVGPTDRAADLEKLATRAGWIDVHAVTDLGGALVATYQGDNLTVIPVHADGVTEPALSDYTADKSLGPVLVSLRQPGPR
jgi:hypothetical protein